MSKLERNELRKIMNDSSPTFEELQPCINCNEPHKGEGGKTIEKLGGNTALCRTCFILKGKEKKKVRSI